MQKFRISDAEEDAGSRGAHARRLGLLVGLQVCVCVRVCVNAACSSARCYKERRSGAVGAIPQWIAGLA